MRIRWTKGALAAAIACALALVIGLVYAFRNPIAGFGLSQGIGAATGMHVSFGGVSVHGDRATFKNVTLGPKNGETLARIGTVNVRYNLRDVLPGGKRLYGLESVDVVNPHVTVVHNADGSYNLPHLAANQAGANKGTPLNMHLTVRGGTLTYVDRTGATARTLTLNNLHADATIDTKAVTRYSGSVAYRANGASFPITASGRIDRVLGFERSNVRAAKLPLADLVNVALRNSSVTLHSGELRDLTIRAFGFEQPDGSFKTRLAGSAKLAGGMATVRGISAPIRGVAGTLDLYTNGVTTQGIHARLGSLPVRIAGGIYDLHAPRFHLALTGSGNLASLKALTPSTRTLPVSGPIAFSMLAEGSAHAPLVLLAIDSPGIAYAQMPIDDPHALVALDGREADVFGLSARYEGLALNGRGAIGLRTQPGAVAMLLRVTGPSDRLPYAAAAIPGMQMHGVALASGNDVKHVLVQGALSGNGPGEQLAGLFAVNAAGRGTVGPLELQRNGGSVFADVALNRAENTATAVIRAHDFHLARAQTAATLNAAIYGTQSNGQTGGFGSVDAQIASLGGSGTLHASGSFAGTNRAAFKGRYRGSLAALTSLAGGLPASGSVDAPVAIVYDDGRTVAQIDGAHFNGATVRGVPISGLSATIGTRGKQVDVYAARANVAGGEALASGHLGGEGRVAISVAHADVSALHGAGVPANVQGTADAAATAGGSLQSPDVSGALLLSDARYSRYGLDAQSAFSYAGDSLRLRDGVVGMGPAFVAIDGSIAGIRLGAPIVPQYDLHATMRGADAGALVAYVQPRLASQAVEGGIDADVHVGGSGQEPQLAGTIAVPAGSVHGLGFRDLHAALHGTPSDLAITGGSVIVGSTALAFDAAIAPGNEAASVRAPHADLADFNDYFDPGDVLGGRGSLSVAAALHGSSISTTGSVDLANVRYKRLTIGQTVATWDTSGNTISADAGVGGSAGRAHLTGTFTLVPGGSPLEVARRASVDVQATASGVQLGTWLPMLGYQDPVTGTLDATATANGRFPDVDLRASASLHDGIVHGVPVQKLEVAATARGGRGRISSATLQIPNLSATGSGTFGLHATDRMNLALRAISPDVGALAKTITGKPADDVSGALDTTLHVTGTRDEPLVGDALTISNLRYRRFTIPRVAANLAVSKHAVTLQSGSIDLPHGNVVASARVPITMSPFGIGPRTAPVTLHLNVNNVNVADAAAAFDPQTKIAGIVAGTLNVTGALDAPQLGGALALSGGSFSGPLESRPITDAHGRIAFSGTSVALQDVAAKVGSGTLAMSGTASVPTLRDVKAVAFSARLSADNAQFDSPKYFKGTVTADVTAARASGGIPRLAGTVNVPSGRIPLSAFWNPNAPKASPKPLPDIALDLRATVGNDVRVQSTNVDVGAQGAVTLGGTLPHPTLDGSFTSTGGTISFLRTFRINSANVRFQPRNGIMPYVDAYASTQVANPFTFVSLHVTGLAPDNMNLAFQSDPPYGRSQILALLVGGGAAGSFNAATQVQNLATAQLNTFFARQLLEPISASLGNALGLSNFEITNDLTGGFGLNAAKAFGRNLTAVYSQNLGQPRRQSLSLEAMPTPGSAIKLMVYDVQDAGLLGSTQQTNLFGFNDIGTAPLLQPMLGSSGVSLTWVHKFD